MRGIIIACGQVTVLNHREARSRMRLPWRRAQADPMLRLFRAAGFVASSRTDAETALQPAVMDAFRSETGIRLADGEEIRSVQNRQLQTLIWLNNRTLPTGETIGLPEVISYEKAGGTAILSYEHIDMILRLAQCDEPA